MSTCGVCVCMKGDVVCIAAVGVVVFGLGGVAGGLPVGVTITEVEGSGEGLSS